MKDSKPYFLLCLALFIPVSSADTILVPDDYGTIQEAIDVAAAGDTVLVSPGTYMEKIDFMGKAITVMSSDGAEATVIDAGQTGSAVVCRSGEGLDTVLEGFTLTNGTGTPYPINNYWGGGMFNELSSPTVIACTFCDNSATWGGGMLNLESSPEVTDCTFTKNEAMAGCGMASYDPDLGGLVHSPKITGCTFSNNASPDCNKGGGLYEFRCNSIVTDCLFFKNMTPFPFGTGGGIYIEQSDSTITNCTFENNSAIRGGGISIYHCNPVIDSCTFTKNTATESGGGIACMSTDSSAVISNSTIAANYAPLGGGIHCESFAGPRIINNIIKKNVAGDEGGGICCHQSSFPTVSDNLIANNRAIEGGGGIFCRMCLQVAAIVNNTIIENSAITTGGGIGCASSSPMIMNNVIAHNDTITRGGGISCSIGSSPRIINNTLTANQTESAGGGIYCAISSEPTISNTILWKNRGWNGPELCLEETNTASECSIHHCTIQGGQAMVYIGPNYTLNWGDGMLDTDPLFVDPESGDYRLQQDPCQPGVVNPCVDAGSMPVSNLCMDACWTRTDETPDTGIVDIGYHGGPLSRPTLLLDIYELPETGGSIRFEIMPGREYFQRNYLLLGGVSGTEPGTALPGGLVTLPLNLDTFTYDVLLPLLNSSVFYWFMLDIPGNGCRWSILNAPPLPGFAGLTMYYAYCLNNPYDFVSNPVEVLVVP